MSKRKRLMLHADANRFAMRFLACVVLATCLWQVNAHRESGFEARDQVTIPVAHNPQPSRRLKTVPIRDLRCGMRVLADNPELDGLELPDSEVDPRDWRLIRLVMQKPAGGRIEIELLRPTEWLFLRTVIESVNQGIVHRNANMHNVLIGKQILLAMPELGVDGSATVQDILPCPPLERSRRARRRLVTGTFRHSAADVMELVVAGEFDAIRVTGNHPFWSVDREAFVPASHLQVGENLARADQIATHVLSIAPIRGRSVEVFNLEVDAEHVFFVGATGILVHNNYPIEIHPDKFKYLFGNVRSSPKNTARSLQNAQQLARIGIHDTPEGIEYLTKHLDDVVQDSTNIAKSFEKTLDDGTTVLLEVRESLLAGPGGFLKLSSGWELKNDGVRRLTTLIPIGG